MTRRTGESPPARLLLPGGAGRGKISEATWTLPLGRKDLKRTAETGGILARPHGGEFAPGTLRRPARSQRCA